MNHYIDAVIVQLKTKPTWYYMVKNQNHTYPLAGLTELVLVDS